MYITRNLTLSLRYTPHRDKVSAYQSNLNTTLQKLSSASVISAHIPIYDDINIERVKFTPTTLAMENEDRFKDIESNVSGLKMDFTAVREDVTNLKTDVSNINDNMDALIRAMNRLESNPQQSTSDMTSSPQSQGTDNRPPPPSHQVLQHTGNHPHPQGATVAKIAPANNHAGSYNPAHQPQGYSQQTIKTFMKFSITFGRSAKMPLKGPGHQLDDGPSISGTPSRMAL